MKRISLLYVLLIFMSGLMFQSCHNDDWSFPDYDNNAVYFAYQYPVRTIVLGEDNNFDTSLDNAHQCEIYAVMSGVYANGNNIGIDFVVDNSLCDNLTYEDGTAVKAMPTSYYTLAGNQIMLNKTMNGAVKVQLSDAFFADPDAIKNTYVIPLRMTSVNGADSILQGTPKYVGAPRTDNTAWDILPKDYVLYCVKFINPWSGSYLRRGVDVVTDGGKTTTNLRHNSNIEKDEVFTIKTTGLKTIQYPFSSSCNLKLTFNDDNTCTVTSATAGITATGSGKFVKTVKGESWGNKDRDVLYLDYKVVDGGKTTATKDTLVAQTRGINGIETFSPVYTSK